MSGTSVDLPLRDRRGVMICREPMQPRPSLASYTRRAARAAAFGAFALASSCAPPSEPASPSIASMPHDGGEALADARPARTGPASVPVVRVRVLAINDFHGNLEPPPGGNGFVTAPPGEPLAPSDAGRDDAGELRVPTGGAVFLAALLTRLRSENPNTVLVSAGDLTGASPLVSGLFDDEPTIEVMNRMGLDIEAVGNHDFDRGVPRLEWLQHGGCAAVMQKPGESSRAPVDAAVADPALGPLDAGSACDAGAFEGARFAYLAANVVERDAGRTLFPPYVVKEWDGARVAFIGETLEHTPAVTNAAAVRGLAFGDEASAANALVPELQKLGVSAIVLVIHQGAAQGPGGTYDSCDGLTGALLPMLDRLDPAIAIVISGHTHQAYDCRIGGRLVTSASSYGRLVTAIDLTLDPAARRIVDMSARNVPVTRDVPPDPQVESVVARYVERARPVADRVVGWVKGEVTGDLRRAGGPSCETPLGDLIADAMQSAGDADVGFMNQGGIRADLVAHRPDLGAHAVTFADAFEIQPFRNDVVTMTLTGAQIRELLQRQYGHTGILQVSRGLSYRYTVDRSKGSLEVSDLRLRGQPLAADRRVRIAVPSYLAGGGDGYQVLREGKDPKTGPLDVTAFADYLGRVSSAAAPLEWKPAARVHGDGCQ